MDHNRHGKEGGRRQQCAKVMLGKVCVLGEEDRRLKKGSGVYICCFSHIDVFGLFACSGLSDCVVRRCGGHMR